MIFDTRTGTFVSNRGFVSVDTPSRGRVARFGDYIARYIGTGRSFPGIAGGSPYAAGAALLARFMGLQIGVVRRWITFASRVTPGTGSLSSLIVRAGRGQ
jgi:hypothetical protein